jgi:hypothetical protein
VQQDSRHELSQAVSPAQQDLDSSFELQQSVDQNVLYFKSLMPWDDSLKLISSVPLKIWSSKIGIKKRFFVYFTSKLCAKLNEI